MLTFIDLTIFCNVNYFKSCQHKEPVIIFFTFLKRRQLTSVYYSTIFSNLVNNITNVPLCPLGIYYSLAEIWLFCSGDFLDMDFPLHSLDDRVVCIDYRWYSDRAKLKYAGKIYSVAPLFFTYPIHP